MCTLILRRFCDGFLSTFGSKCKVAGFGSPHLAALPSPATDIKYLKVPYMPTALHITIFILLMILSATPVAADDILRGSGSAFALPRPVDLAISDDEDLAFLDEVLRSIFPNGTEGLSDEEKGIEILRYASSALELKNNGGSATKIIKEGYAICGGLSHVFRVLCRRAGIPARYIGAFYLRPIMGSHAISEIFYDDAWHLLDPTFGIFFYSKDLYDGSGRIASFQELVVDHSGWSSFKVVDRPWVGRYDDAVRSFNVALTETEYLGDVYAKPIMELYRKYLAETFPVAYGGDEPVSFPVDVDLTAQDTMVVGELDSDSRDVVMQALNGERFVGSHYVGGSFPPGFHTWTIRARKDDRIRITYHATNDATPMLGLLPLKAAHLEAVGHAERQSTFYLKMIQDEAIVVVTCPEGTFVVDAMTIGKLGAKNQATIGAR